MPYLGKLPTTGAFQKLDAISTVNGQAAYTMQIGGVDFSPESPNHMLVTVNGILQSPTTNYTISGSTITFTSALVTGDVINSIIILGDVLNVGTPSDATVTTGKIVDGNVTLAKLSATGTKDSTTFLRGDNAFAVPPSGGLVFISGVTLSNVASTTFTGIDSTYETYIFMLNNVVPVSDGVQLYMRTSTDGGSSYDSGSSDYDTRSCAVNNSNNFEATGSVDSTFMGLNQGSTNIGSASGEGISLVVHLYQPSNSSLFTTMSYQGTAIYSEGSMRPQFGSGARMATSDVDAVQFLFSSGNLESGEINMYGVVKS